MIEKLRSSSNERRNHGPSTLLTKEAIKSYCSSMCLPQGTMRTRRGEQQQQLGRVAETEGDTHACAKSGKPHVNDTSSCAYVRTYTTIFHLPTYRPTTGPSIRARQGTILAHGGSTCSNQRAAARSRGQTGRIFAFDPSPSPLSAFTTSLPSYLILLEDLGYFPSS